MVKPRRADVTVDLVAVAWLPYWEFLYTEGDRTLRDRIPAW